MSEEGNVAYKTISELGFDIGPAQKSLVALSEDIDRFNKKLNEMVASSGKFSTAMNQAFAGPQLTKALADMNKFSSSMTAMLELSGSKQYATQAKLNQKLEALEEKHQVKITQMKEQFRADQLRAAEKHALQLAELQARIDLLTEKKINESVKRAPKQTPMMEALGYRTSWFITGSLFYGTIRGASAIVKAYKEIEDSMIRIGSVMDKETTDLKALQDEIFEVSKAYGILATRLADAALEWAKQGKAQREIEQLLRPTALLANIGEIEDMSEAVKLLTATMKQFGMEASESMRIIDVWTGTADQFAVKVRDLAEGMAVAGAAGKNMGVTFEEMTGHIAALGEATGKSGKEVGQSLKTIYAYLLRPDTAKALESLGFRVKEDIDTYRSVSEILKDVANEWQNLTSVEQYNLAMKAAGARRVSDFITLLDHHNEAIKATIIATASMGSAERKNEEIMESYKKTIERFNATLQELSVSLGDAGLISVLEGVTKGATSALETFKGWPPALKQIVEVVGMLSLALTALNLGTSVFAGTTLLQWIGGGSGVAGLAAITGALTSPLGLAALGAGATTLAVGTAIGLAEKSKKEAAEEARTLEDNYKAYEAMTEIMEKSEKGTIEYITAKKELNKILERFAEIAPNVVESWDDMGRAASISTKRLEDHIEAQNTLAGDTLEAAIKRRKAAEEEVAEIKARKDKWIESEVERRRIMTGSLYEGLSGGKDWEDREKKVREDSEREWQRALAFAQKEEAAAKEAERAIRRALSALEDTRRTQIYADMGYSTDPAWWDEEGKKHVGMFPGPTERHFWQDPKLWDEPLRKTIPVIEESKDLMERLKDEQTELTLAHKREVAMLSIHANEIERTNLKLKQNAESQAQVRKEQAATASQRDKIAAAIAKEEARYKSLTNEYNNLQESLSDIQEAQWPEAEKKNLEDLEKQLRESKSTVASLDSQHKSIDKTYKDQAKTLEELEIQHIELNNTQIKNTDAYEKSLRNLQRTLESVIGLERTRAQLEIKREHALLEGGEAAASIVDREILENSVAMADKVLKDLVSEAVVRAGDMTPSEWLQWQKDYQEAINGYIKAQAALEIFDKQQAKRLDEEKKRILLLEDQEKIKREISNLDIEIAKLAREYDSASATRRKRELEDLKDLANIRLLDLDIAEARARLEDKTLSAEDKGKAEAFIAMAEIEKEVLSEGIKTRAQTTFRELAELRIEEITKLNTDDITRLKLLGEAMDSFIAEGMEGAEYIFADVMKGLMTTILREQDEFQKSRMAKQDPYWYFRIYGFDKDDIHGTGEALANALSAEVKAIYDDPRLTLEERLEKLGLVKEMYAEFAEYNEVAFASFEGTIESAEKDLEAFNIELAESGLEDFTDKVDEAQHALSMLDATLRGKPETLDALKSRFSATEEYLETLETLASEIQKTIDKETEEAGPSPTKGKAEFIQGLGRKLRDTNLEIAITKVNLESLGDSIESFPIIEKLVALNDSLEEYSRTITQAVIAQEHFAEGLHSEIRLMEIQRQKFQATRDVARAYKDALTEVTNTLTSYSSGDKDLFSKIASGSVLDEFEIARLNQLSKELPEGGQKALDTLFSLRDESGRVSESVLDMAFSLYRATLEAYDLAEAVDAIIAGGKELGDTFDSYKERRALEDAFNFNQIFGMPAERALSDWQHEFDKATRSIEAIADIRAGADWLAQTEKSEEALESLKESLREIAKDYPDLKITDEMIDSFGSLAEITELAKEKLGELGVTIQDLVSRKYFLELAREVEELGKSFEQNLEGAFKRAISDVLKGETDLLNILSTFSTDVIGNMADTLAQGLTRRIFGDPNNPDSLAGQIQQWATGQAGDAFGIHSGIVSGGELAAISMEAAIISGGQAVASMWSVALGTGGNANIIAGLGASTGGLSLANTMYAGSARGPTTGLSLWNSIYAGGKAGLSTGATAAGLGAGLGTAGAGLGAAGGLGAALAGFNWPVALAVMGISLLTSMFSRQSSQQRAAAPKDQYHYKIYSPEFNPFASPERVYFSGSGREMTEVGHVNLNFGKDSVVINAKDGTDAGNKFAQAAYMEWQKIQQTNSAGSWGVR